MPTATALNEQPIQQVKVHQRKQMQYKTILRVCAGFPDNDTVQEERQGTMTGDRTTRGMIQHLGTIY